MSDEDKAINTNNIPTQTENNPNETSNYALVPVSSVRDVPAQTYGPQKRSNDESDSPKATVTVDRWGYTTGRAPDPPLACLDPKVRALADWKPKIIGLDNLGNTCFMNAGLQCLLHTTELSHFFLRGFYKRDLNVDNPLGCKGKLAESYNLLVDQTHSHTPTWTVSKDFYGYAKNSVSPHFVKRRVAAFSTQFEGFQQHDSQELICFLLDGIHEDLNRVKKKPYVENVVGDGTNDVAVAAEAWDRYKMRNDSFVVDTFQGQIRSRVTCNECHNMSVSFDPSMYLSVSFKKTVSAKRWKCAVKFTDPTARRLADHDRALDFADTEKLPEGFCFDCLVEVTVKEGDTYGSLIKLFEQRCPERRFVALSWAQEYYCKGFKEFLQAGTELPEKLAHTCVILEVPCEVADGWWEMSGLTPPVNIWLQKPKPSLLSDIERAAKARMTKLDPTLKDSSPAPSDVEDAAAAVASAAAPKAEADSSKSAKKWYDAAGPDKLGLCAMVNFGSLHVGDGNYHGASPFLRNGTLKRGEFNRTTWSWMPDHMVYEYPLEVQQQAVESSSLIPVIVFVRKTTKGYTSTTHYNTNSELDKHASVDIANCFWMAKGSRLTRLDVVKKMQSTMRHAVEDASAVDDMVTEMESGGRAWTAILHVSVLDKVAEGAPRTPFPEDTLEVNEPLALALDWTPTALTPKLSSLLPAEKAYRAEEVAPPTTLEALLQAYVEEEQLNGPNQWRCPHCKKDCDASKQMHLWRSSDIFIVHLKRFGVDQYGMRSRLNTFVDVPLGEVDFSPYFAPDSPFRVENNRYRLYAVSNHTGGYGGGHYYAYCRPNDGEQWVEFNDSSVHQNLNPASIITKDAYVLFFRRVSEAPHTLQNIQCNDERCQESSSWFQELGNGGLGGGAASE